MRGTRTSTEVCTKAMTAKENWTVEHFMTLQPCTVDYGLSLQDAKERMEANNIRHLVATRGNWLVGVLSSRDIAVAINLPGVKASKVTVGEAMSQHVYTCQTSEPLEEVATKMEEERYGCAVVLRGEAVVGIFTTTDALRALRAVIAGKPVEPRTVPTHLVDVTKERQRTEHHVRLGDLTRGPSARDGLVGTIGL
jgi:acetoin utilization protein AcuB